MRPLTILVGGASGFLGSHLVRSLASDGCRVVRLARPDSRAAVDPDAVVSWDPERGWLDREALRRHAPDVVINLAGERIDQRWTERHRQRIRASRVEGTRLLASALRELPERPRVLVNASAVGVYGAHRGDEVLSETSEKGSDFLAEVTTAWEAATQPAAAVGVRVVLMRSGIVLGRDGGVLARLRLPFLLGLGGRIGSGRQWVSWVSLSDWVSAARYAISNDSVSGPLNIVSPEPVQNAEFTRALGHALRRPAVLRVPAFVLRLLLGQMARDTVLASQRAVPERLRHYAFSFAFPQIESALVHELRS